MQASNPNDDISIQFAQLLKDVERHLFWQKSELWDGVPFDPRSGPFFISSFRSNTTHHPNRQSHPSSFQQQRGKTSSYSPHPPSEQGQRSASSSTIHKPTSPQRSHPQRSRPNTPLEIGWRRIDGKVDIPQEELKTRQKEWHNLQVEMQGCQRCELCQNVQKISLGIGQPRRRLMLIGSAPNLLQDDVAQMYQGELGELLNGILQAMGLKREEVYLTTAVKGFIKDPENPTKQQVSACSEYLKKEIRLIQPEAIITFGAMATWALLGDQHRLRDSLGRWFQFEGIPFLPTYCLRFVFKFSNPPRYAEIKKKIWEDIQQVIRQLTSLT